jgi:hypothetical protein
MSGLSRTARPDAAPQPVARIVLRSPTDRHRGHQPSPSRGSSEIATASWAEPFNKGFHGRLPCRQFIGIGRRDVQQAAVNLFLQQAVIEELVKRAGLSWKSRGKMQVSLLDKEYEAVVEEYDSFGESAYNLTLKERKKKAGG